MMKKPRGSRGFLYKMSESRIAIQEVRTGKDLLRFIKLPWRLYEDDPNWVPPLISERKAFFDPAKNPFFDHAEVRHFLAVKEGELVGRISAIVNRNHNQVHSDRVGFFGFFESVKDYEVAARLYDAAREFLRSRGMNIMRGPMNFSTNEELGFLLEGYDSPPVFMMTYNPKYYLDFGEEYGLRKAKDLYAYYMHESIKPPERIVRVAEKVKRKRNLTIRRLDIKKLNSEIRIVKEIYNSAWADNWGFVPMTEKEFDHMAKEMKKILDPDLVLIAEVDGQPAGFSLALPNLNQVLHRLNGRLFPLGIFKLLWYAKVKRIINGVRILTAGVVEKHRFQGIDNIFYLDTYRIGTGKGYTWGEFSWILEDNHAMNSALETLGARIYKKYRIYEMEI
jgi:hypothetical protein